MGTFPWRDSRPRWSAWTESAAPAEDLAIRGALDEAESCWWCRDCGTRFPTRRGVPVFSHGREMIQSRLLETHPTNPNGEDQTTIITNPANGLVLDLGAGNPRADEH